MTIHGATSEPGATITVQSSERVLGLASSSDRGRWSFDLPSGPIRLLGLSASINLPDGETAAFSAAFDLIVHPRGGGYAIEQDFYSPSGDYLSSSYSSLEGRLTVESDYTSYADGSSSNRYHDGAFFTGLSYSSFTEFYDRDSQLTAKVLENNDGSHTIQALLAHQILHSLGDDTFSGGGQSQSFVFTAGFGQDTILDFKAAGRDHDSLVLASTGFATIDDLLKHTSMKGSNAVIHVDRSDSITLIGVTKAQLRANRRDIVPGG